MHNLREALTLSLGGGLGPAVGAGVQGEGQEQLSRHFFQLQDNWKQALPGQAKGAFRKREMKGEEVTLKFQLLPQTSL